MKNNLTLTLTDDAFFYLAGPYDHEDLGVRVKRTRAFASMTCAMQLAGFSVHSPINQGVTTGVYLPWEEMLSHDFWMQQDLPILRASFSVVCLLLPGWEDSKGLEEEMKVVKAGKPCRIVGMDKTTTLEDLRKFYDHFDIPPDAEHVTLWPDFFTFHELVNLKAPSI